MGAFRLEVMARPDDNVSDTGMPATAPGHLIGTIDYREDSDVFRIHVPASCGVRGRRDEPLSPASAILETQPPPGDSSAAVEGGTIS